MTPATAYEAVVARAQADDRIVGLILTGSRGRGPHARDDSDWDIRLVVRDDAESDAAAFVTQREGRPIDMVVLSLTEFGRAAEIGAPDEWDRYSYAYAQVVVDKLDGRITALVRSKGVLPPDEAANRAQQKLDEYINSYYRSAKNLTNGLSVESRLDAAESIPPCLAALFAMYERVRPYNKFLTWELTQHPLGDPAWAAESFIPRLHRIVTTGDIAEQQHLFRDLERQARDRGHDRVIDGWEPDVTMLRGDAVPRQLT